MFTATSSLTHNGVESLEVINHLRSQKKKEKKIRKVLNAKLSRISPKPCVNPICTGVNVIIQQEVRLETQN